MSMIEHLLSLEHWWLTPVSFVIFTIGTAVGVNGAALLSPFLVFAFPYLPANALFAIGLITDVVGLLSGGAGFIWQRAVDWRTVGFVSVLSLPAAIGGAIARQYMPKTILLFCFAGLILLLCFYIALMVKLDMRLKRPVHVASQHRLPANASWQSIDDVATDTFSSMESYSANDEERSLLESSGGATNGISFERIDSPGLDESVLLPHASEIIQEIRSVPKSPTFKEEFFDRKIELRDGTVYRYLVGAPPESLLLILASGATTGMLSVGIGEVLSAILNARCRVPFRIASGTSLVATLLTICAANATTMALEHETFPWHFIIFSAPGALLGGAIGSIVASKLPIQNIEPFLVGVYVAIATAIFACGYADFKQCGWWDCHY